MSTGALPSVRFTAMTGFVLSGILLTFAIGGMAHAQLFDPRTIPADVTLTVSPDAPTPQSSVRATLKSETFDLEKSLITWTINGSELTRGVGVESVDMRAGGLGSETVIEVYVETPDGNVGSARATFRPTELDLVWESDSYTPPFYRGRALPSAGSTLALQAFARFKRADGFVAPADITYTWRADGTLLSSLSGRGRSSVRIPGPSLYGSKKISVSATAEGFASSASVVISSVEPVLRLYIDHPLLGAMFHQALGTNARTTDAETTLVASPLYAPARNLADQNLVYAWRVNGTAIEPDPAEPEYITLSASEGAQSATVELSLTHRTNWYLESTGEWNITLGSARGTADPFRAGGQ